MFKKEILGLSDDLKSSSFIDEVSTHVSDSVLPVDNSEALSFSGAAGADASRRESVDKLSIQVKSVLVDPWHYGSHSGHRNNMSIYLSVTDARDILALYLKKKNPEAMICFAIFDDNEEKLSKKLISLCKDFPNTDLLYCRDRALNASSHEDEKRFIHRADVELGKLSSFQSSLFENRLSPLGQSISLSESIKDTPSDLLDRFKQKRSSRLNTIKTNLSDIVFGSADNVFIGKNGDLENKFNEALLGNEQAPFCCLFSFIGNNSDINDLLEVVLGNDS